jgi:hypothetical protein
MKRQSLLLTAGLIILTAAASSVTAQAATAHHQARHVKLYNSVQTPGGGAGGTSIGTDYDFATWPEGRPDYHGSN